MASISRSGTRVGEEGVVADSQHFFSPPFPLSPLALLKGEAETLGIMMQRHAKTDEEASNGSLFVSFKRLLDLNQLFERVAPLAVLLLAGSGERLARMSAVPKVRHECALGADDTALDRGPVTTSHDGL